MNIVKLMVWYSKIYHKLVPAIWCFFNTPMVIGIPEQLLMLAFMPVMDRCSMREAVME